MLLHIGADKSISKDKIIAILDNRIINKSSITRECVERSKSDVIMASPEEQEVKSVIITEEKIYLSAISSITLKKRVLKLPLY